VGHLGKSLANSLAYFRRHAVTQQTDEEGDCKDVYIFVQLYLHVLGWLNIIV